MSTSIIILDQNFNANDVDIMVFEPSVLFPPAQFGGGGLIDDMVLKFSVWEMDIKILQLPFIFQS